MEMELQEEDGSSLPNDMFYEILSRTSLRSLYDCRRVCRAWRRITYEPSFISQHCRRTQTISGYFLQTIRRNVYSSTFVPFLISTSSSSRKRSSLSSSSTQPPPPLIPQISLDFLPKGTKILSVANRYGIMCCESPTNNHRIPRYIICKPATKQWRSIPNPKTRFHTEKVAIFVEEEPPSTSPSPSPSTDVIRFKIVRLSTSHLNNNIIVDIFDSRTWRWRHCHIKHYLPYFVLSQHDPGVEMRGVAHWLLPYDDAIFAFDIEREDWRLIPLPKWAGTNKYEKTKLVVGWEGRPRLCLLRILKDIDVHEVEIWALVDYSEGRWEIVGRRELACLISSETVEDLYTHQLAFLTSLWGATWYDMRSGEMTRVDIKGGGGGLGSSEHVFKYESDLQSCHLGYTSPVDHVLEKKKEMKKKKKKEIQQRQA